MSETPPPKKRHAADLIQEVEVLTQRNAALQEGAVKMEALLRTLMEGNPGHEAARIVQDVDGVDIDLANIPRLQLEEEWTIMKTAHDKMAEENQALNENMAVQPQPEYASSEADMLDISNLPSVVAYYGGAAEIVRRLYNLSRIGRVDEVAYIREAIGAEGRHDVLQYFDHIERLENAGVDVSGVPILNAQTLDKTSAEDSDHGTS